MIINQETGAEDFIKALLVLSKGHCGLAVYSLLETINVINKESFNSYCMEVAIIWGTLKKDLDLGIEHGQLVLLVMAFFHGNSSF